jgi:NAD(P)-dependent dehydrogenase (short-subunit alcohol dehydrogenase family)
MNQIDLKDRVAAITGGAQGIGYAISERLLQPGARVVSGTSMRRSRTRPADRCRCWDRSAARWWN